MPNGYLGNPEFRDLAVYSNRAAYLLSQGIPAARIALYHPTTSMWLGDGESDKSTLSISKQLLENQFDYDFVDEQALTETLKLKNKQLMNDSGQGYSAIIIPSATVISSKALSRLEAFQKAGGTVVFMGGRPKYVSDKTFMGMKTLQGANWGILEASGNLTEKVQAALPRDVVFNKMAPSVKYLHRKLKDADFYFFFNEGESSQELDATLRGRGEVTLWDPLTAEITSVKNIVPKGDNSSLKLSIPGHGTRYLLITSSK